MNTMSMPMATGSMPANRPAPKPMPRPAGQVHPRDGRTHEVASSSEDEGDKPAAGNVKTPEAAETEDGKPAADVARSPDKDTQPPIAPEPMASQQPHLKPKPKTMPEAKAPVGSEDQKDEKDARPAETPQKFLGCLI